MKYDKWKELVLDIHNCRYVPCNRIFLKNYLDALCDLIDMEQEDLHYWDYEGDSEGYEKAADHLKGISAIQFIKTSNITIHTIDVPRKVFINVFSCKDFDVEKVCEFTQEFFAGEIMNKIAIERR